MSLIRYSGKLSTDIASCEPATPLWQIVPVRDEDGRPLADFMLFIPKLRTRPQPHIDAVIAHIQCVLNQHPEVVFVHLNLAINVLWVSVKSRPGIITEMASAILERVPEARLVAEQRH
ncbi:MAG TPA: hypothetical protein VIU93_09115 [Gallionellaceae bacterium]